MPGVIFDMDGVLVDSYKPHLLSWQQTATRYGLSLTDEDFRSTFGRTSREIIAHLWPGKMTDAMIREFDTIKEVAYRDVLKTEFPEMPGAGALIAALQKAGFALAIGSSGPPENVELVQQMISNGRYITAAVNGMQVKHGKPEPDVFLLAAEKLGISPRDCAVIEDAPAGIEAARRAGMTAIALLGTAPREVLERRAHVVVERLDELSPEIISRWIEKSRA